MAITKWSTPDVMAITKWSIQGAAMANSCQHNGAMARNAQTFLRPRWFNPHQPQTLWRFERPERRVLDCQV